MTTNNPGGNDYGQQKWDGDRGETQERTPGQPNNTQSGAVNGAAHGAASPVNGGSHGSFPQGGFPQGTEAQSADPYAQHPQAASGPQAVNGPQAPQRQSSQHTAAHFGQQPGAGQAPPPSSQPFMGSPVPPSARQQGPQQAAPKQPKRWSTTSLVAMVLAGSLVAGATTAVVGNQLSGSGIGSRSVTSFDQNKPTSDTKKNQGRPPAAGSVEEVASKVLPSVVSIQVKTARSGADGSGSIISNDGLIVTNNHVVAGAEDGGAQISVQLNDGRVLKAQLVATDPTTDVAVIKAQGANDLQPIKFGDSNKLNVGQDVVAIGSPLGLASTVTTGIVSAKNRPVQAGGEKGGEASLIDAIQTDAAINPGNSGGALVNMDGELVGIPSVIASLGGGEGQQSGSIGLGFAIPVNQAQDIAKQLAEKKKVEHPAIGAQVNTGRTAPSLGAEIVRVEKGSPADRAGLEDGDVVLKVDDRLVEGGVGLIAAIRSHRVGDTVTLTLLRNGKGSEKKIEVTLGSR